MKILNLAFLLFWFIQPAGFNTFSQNAKALNKISVQWQNVKPEGSIEILNGKLEGLYISQGKGKISTAHFTFNTGDNNRLEMTLGDIRVNYGSGTTVVSVRSGENAFSFFLRDVSIDYPIYIPDYHVIVCPYEDKRTYSQIENDIRRRNLQTKLQLIEALPEESFDSASVHTRNQVCPTWLGISRDIRIFEIGNPQDMDMIIPRIASSPIRIPGNDKSDIMYGYMTGRGQSVENNRIRRLEEGVLPILNTTQTDGDIEYKTTTFVTLENSRLEKTAPIGTHYLFADSSSYGHMFTPAQEASLELIARDELKK